MASTWEREQIVGVLKEVKPFERRVALTPSGVAALVADGRTVVVESGAGDGSSFPDTDYAAAGARVVPTAAEVADLAKRASDCNRWTGPRSSIFPSQRS